MANASEFVGVSVSPKAPHPINCPMDQIFVMKQVALAAPLKPGAAAVLSVHTASINAVLCTLRPGSEQAVCEVAFAPEDEAKLVVTGATVHVCGSLVPNEDPEIDSDFSE